MTYGLTYRVLPRVRVHRGYPGNEPTSITRTAPVTANVTIYSGQVISLSSGAWVLGCAAGLTPFIAYHDSIDPDVLSSGQLTGLSCAGKFVIETGWFTAATGAYNADDLPLIADSGTVVQTLPCSGAGCIKLASGWNDTHDIIATTINGGQQAASVTNSEASGTFNTVAFVTTWLPKRT